MMAAPSRVIRQSSRLLIQTPGGEGYLYSRPLLDHLACPILTPVVHDPDGHGRAFRSVVDPQWLVIEMGGMRYWLLVADVHDLIRGRKVSALLTRRDPVTVRWAGVRA
jgi:hypothetical protein